MNTRDEQQSRPTRRSVLKSAAAFTVASTLGAGFLVGCERKNGAAGGGAAKPAAKREPVKLSFVTPFQHLIGHSDVYVAIAKGFFAEEGLDVTPIGGTGTATSVVQVSAGKAAFGESSPIVTAPAIAGGDASMIHVSQKDWGSRYHVASLPSKPLNHPSEWQGKTIGVVSLGGSTEKLLDAMAFSAGLDPKNVKKVVTGGDISAYEFLRRGDVDGIVSYLGQEVTFRLNNIALHYLDIDKFAPVPGNSAIVNLKFAEEHGDLVTAYLRGCRRGYQFMADEKNTDAVLEAFGKWNPSGVQNRDLAIAQLRAEVEVARPKGGKSDAFHSIDLEHWKAGLSLMERAGFIAAGAVPLDKLVTTKFIDRV